MKDQLRELLDSALFALAEGLMHTNNALKKEAIITSTVFYRAAVEVADTMQTLYLQNLGWLTDKAKWSLYAPVDKSDLNLRIAELSPIHIGLERIYHQNPHLDFQSLYGRLTLAMKKNAFISIVCKSCTWFNLPRTLKNRCNNIGHFARNRGVLLAIVIPELACQRDLLLTQSGLTKHELFAETCRQRQYT